jgi:hypothetical protein
MTLASALIMLFRIDQDRGCGVERGPYKTSPSIVAAGVAAQVFRAATGTGTPAIFSFTEPSVVRLVK